MGSHITVSDKTSHIGAKTKTQRILKFDIELDIHCRSAQVKVLDHLIPNTTNIHHYKKMAEVQFAKHQKVLAKSKAPPTIWDFTISEPFFYNKKESIPGNVRLLCLSSINTWSARLDHFVHFNWRLHSEFIIVHFKTSAPCVLTIKDLNIWVIFAEKFRKYLEKMWTREKP